jgi:hypothetical protein
MRPLDRNYAIVVIENSFPGPLVACIDCMHCMRLLYVDMGHTAYYGIGDSKFRKILEMTFLNVARLSSFAAGSGICGSILRIGRAAGRCLR